MNATYLNQDGERMLPVMGCYGIGLERLLAAVVQANHDDRGIVWPPSVAPYDVHIVATGANREAANALGIRTDRVRISALVASATAAAFAGVMLAGRLAIGRHDLGENDLLTVIAAVVIGGTSLFGGRGSVPGAVVGAAVMAMLNNGLILMGLRVADQLIARGAIIILAVALSMREQKET